MCIRDRCEAVDEDAEAVDEDAEIVIHDGRIVCPANNTDRGDDVHTPDEEPPHDPETGEMEDIYSSMKVGELKTTIKEATPDVLNCEPLKVAIRETANEKTRNVLYRLWKVRRDELAAESAVENGRDDLPWCTV